MEVDVVVRKGGHFVCSVSRPLRQLPGGPHVTYRGKLWPLQDGEIDIQPVTTRAPSMPASPPVDEVAERPAGREFVPDEAQRKVIEAPATARILVEAGPGSGKTEVTARRIAALMAGGLSPARLLVLSFSRSAVRTLTRRLSSLSASGGELENLRHVSIRTFDSWAFRLLRLSGEQPGVLLRRTHDANIRQVADLLAGSRSEEMRTLVGDRRHIFVDEFQDLTGCRARMVDALLSMIAPPGSEQCGFTILGDPAQAIYGFSTRNSDETDSAMDLWREIRDRYGSEIQSIPLGTNHRSAEDISKFGLGIRKVLESALAPKAKLGKVMKCIEGLPGPGGDLGPDWISRPFRTSAVLTRTNGEAVRLVQKLLGSGIGQGSGRLVLRAAGGASLPPAWVAALLAPAKSASVTRSGFEKIYRSVSGALGESSRHALGMPSCEDAWIRLANAAGGSGDDPSFGLADLRSRISWPDAFPDDELQPEAGLYVTTIHQSKGMEFDEVHLLEPMEDSEADGEEALEQASVAFVAVTRAGRKLGRIPSKGLYSRLTRRSFQQGPDRLTSWWKGWVNMEMGVPGDISSYGFVDINVHGSAEAVTQVQERLRKDAGGLPGRKVVLLKTGEPGKRRYFYDIHLQEKDGEAGLKLGRTSGQLTYALLDLLTKKGYPLPRTIWNLRIASVGTLTAGLEAEADIPQPWASSRLWLGCSLMGTGDFKPFRKGRK